MNDPAAHHVPTATTLVCAVAFTLILSPARAAAKNPSISRDVAKIVVASVVLRAFLGYSKYASNRSTATGTVDLPPFMLIPGDRSLLLTGGVRITGDFSAPPFTDLPSLKIFGAGDTIVGPQRITVSGKVVTPWINYGPALDGIDIRLIDHGPFETLRVDVPSSIVAPSADSDAVKVGTVVISGAINFNGRATTAVYGDQSGVQVTFDGTFTLAGPITISSISYAPPDGGKLDAATNPGPLEVRGPLTVVGPIVVEARLAQ